MDWVAYWWDRYGCSSPSTKGLHVQYLYSEGNITTWQYVFHHYITCISSIAHCNHYTSEKLQTNRYTKPEFNRLYGFDPHHQCDQMASLFFQYFAIYNNELLPNST